MSHTLDAFFFPHRRGNGRAPGKPISKAMAEPLGSTPPWTLPVTHRQGTGRALGKSAALDLFPFPISEALAELLGRLTHSRRQGNGRALVSSPC
jgi:hypothetical protein